MFCSKCGKPLADGVGFCSYCGAPVADPAGAAPAASIPSDPGGVAARVQRKAKTAGVLWLIIGIVQVCLIFAGVFPTAAVGAWNIYNAVVRLRNVKNITPGNSSVVKYYDDQKTGLIILAVVNLILGGIVGAFLAAYELHTRQYVLDNAGAFDPAAAPVAAEKVAADFAARGGRDVPVVCPGCSNSFTLRINAGAVPGSSVKFKCPKCKTETNLTV